MNVNAEFDLKVQDGEEDDEEGLYLRVELWNSADHDEEVGFTQVEAQHTSMPKWFELHNDDGGESTRTWCTPVVTASITP